MPTFLSFLLRVFLVAGGLLFAASLAVLVVLMAGIWGVRSAWATLTGRPVMPFMMRIDPRAGFDRMYRRPVESRASRTPRADAVHPQANAADITDVEARSPRP
ncbi:MAG: hypothetical protein JWP43_1220 [Ramlibacter sp.]|jgi:hypothetical protein|nr:hypothetical protein [Ramlibacter sp.]